MGITTKTGDEGSTDLWSGGRVPKDDPRIEALGCVDELSSLLGFARLACAQGPIRDAVEALQRDLVRVAGELASLEPPFRDPIRDAEEEAITRRIRDLEAAVPLRGFVLPGRTEASARLDLARVASRRLERRVVALASMAASKGEGGPSTILRRYLNRLSDYLFMLARSVEAAEGAIEYVDPERNARC
jgi:cob(I)alamin adenosyltransferase